MKTCVSSIFPALRVLCLAAVAVPGAIRAQAPAGPLPAAKPQAAPAATTNSQNQEARAETRTSILGQWKLNRNESDDPQKKMEDARASRGSASGRGSGISIGGVPVGGEGRGRRRTRRRERRGAPARGNRDLTSKFVDACSKGSEESGGRPYRRSEPQAGPFHGWAQAAEV